MATPAINPNAPEINVSEMASITIKERMLPEVAPRALRTPISTVRSFTTMAMMLATPMAPARSVNPPMIQMNNRIPVKMRSKHGKLLLVVAYPDRALIVRVDRMPQAQVTVDGLDHGRGPCQVQFSCRQHHLVHLIAAVEHPLHGGQGDVDHAVSPTAILREMTHHGKSNPIQSHKSTNGFVLFEELIEQVLTHHAHLTFLGQVRRCAASVPP